MPKLTIKDIPIAKIKPAAYNPRKDLRPSDPEYQKLKKAIDTFDLVEPLVWNKRSGNLVGGHQRFKILKERGDMSVTVSVVDLDDRDEKALNLALNKQSGSWDDVMLGAVLAELQSTDLDMYVTGFDLPELESMAELTESLNEAANGSGHSPTITIRLIVPPRAWLTMQSEICEAIKHACADYGMEIEWPK